MTTVGEPLVAGTLTSSPLALVYAIERPSGDHATAGKPYSGALGEEEGDATEATLVNRPLLSATTPTAGLGPKGVTKASRFPSGDHAGALSGPRTRKSRT